MDDMVEMALKKFEGKSPEALNVLLKKREKEFDWGLKTNMIGSGGLLELEIEIKALTILLGK